MSIEKLLKTNVNELLSYCPSSGKFTWNVKRGCRASGQVAGTIKPSGYVSISIGSKPMYAHRLAFLLMTGKLPSGVVDHINGNKSDNRWCNLRDVSQSENMANRFSAQVNSKTGLIGASPHAGGGFVAQIRRNKRLTYLGYFQTAQEAHQKYMEAANECL